MINDKSQAKLFYKAELDNLVYLDNRALRYWDRLPQKNKEKLQFFVKTLDDYNTLILNNQTNMTAEQFLKQERLVRRMSGYRGSFTKDLEILLKANISREINPETELVFQLIGCSFVFHT